MCSKANAPPPNFVSSEIASSEHSALPPKWKPIISFWMQWLILNLIDLQQCQLWKIPNMLSSIFTLEWLFHHK